MAADARILGWAQRRVEGLATRLSLNGILGTGIDPSTYAAVTDQLFEVTAGTPVTIRWGYIDGITPGAFSTGATTNTVSVSVAVYYNTQAVSVVANGLNANAFLAASANSWLASAVKTDTFVGGAGSLTYDSQVKGTNLVFTPTSTGTVRIVVKLQTNVTATNTLVASANSDRNGFTGDPEQLPAGATELNATPGLVRSGTAFSTFAQSGLGGSPGVYHETETNTLTFGAAPRISIAGFTHTISWRSAPGAVNEFITTPIAAYTSTTPNDGGKLINNVFPAASTNMTWNIASASSALSSANGGAALPWIHWTSVPASPGTVVRTDDAAGNAISVEFQNTGTLIDPRLTTTRLLQADDNVFGTPPLIKNTASGVRLTSQLGFYGVNLRDSRGTLSGNSITRGVNGIGLSLSFVDAGGLTSPQVSTFSTVTQGGEAGWVGLKSWSDVLPGGNWTLTATSTTSDATGLLTPSVSTFVLLSKSPDLQLVAGLQPDNKTGNHWHAGDTLLVSAALINQRTLLPVIADAAPKVVFFRLNNTTNVIEIFKAGAWTAFNPTTLTYTNMVAGADATSFVLRQATDSTWNIPVLAFILTFFSGVPYFTNAQIDSVSSVAHPHDHYVFDPTGLFK